MIQFFCKGEEKAAGLYSRKKNFTLMIVCICGLSIVLQGVIVRVVQSKV